MHYHHAVRWLKAFRHSPEAICALYDDDFLFEDVMLDQHDITSKADLHRLFVPYANSDPTNGVGIHNFRIRSYIGDRRAGLIRWEWSPEHAGIFLGLDVTGKPFSTQGHTWHEYNELGLITRESSWWDSAAVLRQVGPVNPSKSVTNIKSARQPRRDALRPASGKDHATRWCELLGSDTDALATLYSDHFSVEDGKVDDHLDDTAIDQEKLVEKLGGLATGENGRYLFTALDYLAGPGCGLIHWTATIEGARTYRGLPADGKTLTTIGSTFHQFDDDARIVLESTFWEDNQVFVQLGLPIQRPHYWREGFDL